MAMPFADSSGVRLHYEDTGSGTPVLFLHELGSDIRQWRGQTGPLSGRFRCIAYNARGYPPSHVPADEQAYRWERFVDDVGAVLDHLQIERAVLVGWSMGAWAALMFALRRPERVLGVAAAGVGSGSPRADQPEFRAGMRALARAWEHEGPVAATALMAENPGRQPLKRLSPLAYDAWLADLKGHSPEGMARTCRNFQGLRPSLEDFADGFARMTLPVLLVLGEEDTLCLETTRWLAGAIPGARLHVVPGGGHAPNLEDESAFNRLLGGFLDQIARR